jgi:hypothetical protein
MHRQGGIHEGHAKAGQQNDLHKRGDHQRTEDKDSQSPKKSTDRPVRDTRETPATHPDQQDGG